ncbi:YHS domain-containing protein [soil metagenome]
MENNKHPSRKVFDLVCSMELDMQNVRHSSEYNGKEYYFCSETCKDHFVNDPEKYIGN